MLTVYLTISGLIFQSDALKEDRLEYVLICMKAKQSWIPFGNLLERRQVFHDIDFGDLYLKKKKGMTNSDKLGGYIPVNFKFSELTLNILTRLIQNS